MASRVMIVDPESGRDCPGGCHHIPRLAETALADQNVQISIVGRGKEAAGELEKAAVIIHWPRAVDPEPPFKSRGGNATSRLAVICRPHASSALLDSFSAECDDFLCCPFHEVDFIARVRRSLRKAASLGLGRTPSSTSGPALWLDQLIGESAAFLESVNRIGPVARSAATVMIGGETGVGKELFARAIHYNSTRGDHPFVPINCSTLPDHLFENELFGHVRGAFTDANAAEGGLLGEAMGGTVFLDEVDMLSPASQAKLLRFLQDHEYRPLGSAKALISDARVIAASNADLRSLVASRQFREDLFHRLNVLPLFIPPLRDRPADVPLLAQHFAARFAAQYGKGAMQFSREAISKLLAYPWPGNVRELEGMVHRAVVFGATAVLDASAIELPSPGSAGMNLSAAARKDQAMGDFERTYLINLLAEHRGNLSRSAVASGKDRRTLQRLLRKYRIERVMFQAS